MLEILKTTPGVSDPKIDETKGEVCLEYQPDEKDRWVQATKFCLDSNFHSTKTEYVFTGIFPGMVSSPDEKLDTHVSASVMKKWKAQCGVYAIGFTE